MLLLLFPPYSPQTIRNRVVPLPFVVFIVICVFKDEGVDGETQHVLYTGHFVYRIWHSLQSLSDDFHTNCEDTSASHTVDPFVIKTVLNLY